MTFRERYIKEANWFNRVMIMEVFHLTMEHKEGRKWGIRQTAKYFNVSIGLVSENLKLARASHNSEEIQKCENRKVALAKLNNNGIVI